jgi:predicted RNA-binding Zn-ribbon protein involved in translation (DUF1610 family)
MEIKIIKTSAQAQLEENSKPKTNLCPECGDYNIGKYRLEDTGFLGMGKTKRIFSYRCIRCKCEWEVTEDY